jgi:hypothetical protein
MPVQSVNYVGDKLVVGPLDYSFIPLVPSIPGTTVLNGPVWMGVGTPIPTATCMIGPGLTTPISLQVTGISNILGILNVGAIGNFTGLNIKLGATLRNALSLTSGINVKSSLNTGSAINVFNSVIVDKTCTATKFIGDITTTIGINPQTVAEITLAKALPAKPFDIKHPNKQGHRLRHVSLEGPEIGVYYRGKLENNNVINLPEYWNGFIDPETITVQLTPFGSYQELFVEKIEWGRKVIIKNREGSAINCYYTIQAERSDLDKLIVEYEGESPKDYPGQDFIGVNR